MLQRFKLWAGMAGVAVVLAACGGGGGGTEMPVAADPLDAMPAEATQSTSTLMAYLERLVKAQGADEREAFAMSSAGTGALPVDDVGEPMPLMMP
ncbi:MAG: hypothetical protein HS128_12195 [Ideonella sp.]|nr:hypothetical protein [Ideonella sp.]MCC7458104.1 hypothetical protein [Nitrospira sp.]